MGSVTNRIRRNVIANRMAENAGMGSLPMRHYRTTMLRLRAGYSRMVRQLPTRSEIEARKAEKRSRRGFVGRAWDSIKRRFTT